MELSLAFAGLVPVVVAATEVVKRTFGVPSRFVALISLVLGVGAVYLSAGSLDILNGVVIGLSASGLYSGVKATVE